MINKLVAQVVIGSYLCLCLQQQSIALSEAGFPLSPQIRILDLLKGFSPLMECFGGLRECL